MSGFPEGEGPVIPEQARARFKRVAADPKHKPVGRNDPRLEKTRDDAIPDGGYDDVGESPDEP